MTEYTAEDFARARVAIQGERESARRTYPGDDMPWLSRNGGRWSDHALAELGWTPVQENVLTDDAIKTLVAKRERVLAFKIREEFIHNPFPSSLRLAAAVYQGLTEKPRPAWLNAPAVQAWHRNDHRTEHDGTPGKPRIWSPDYGTVDTWSTPSLPSVDWSELVDVVPLAATVPDKETAA